MTKPHTGTHLSSRCGRAWEGEGALTHWHKQLSDSRLHGLNLPNKIPQFGYFPWRKMLNIQKPVFFEGLQLGKRLDTNCL